MAAITRRWYLGAAVALSGMLAPACGGRGAAEAPAGGAKPAQQPATLRVNYRSEKYFPERAKEFIDAYPWIKVDLVPDSGYEKLVALLVAGDLGDIIWASTGIGTYYELASQGHFTQLDSLVSSDKKFDLKQYFPRTVETARLEGKLYGLPSLIHPGGIGLFHNVSLFETVGVKLPTLDWTVDDLVDAGRRLTADTDRDGRPDRWGVDHLTAWWALVVVVRSFGGELLEPAFMGKKAALDRPAAKQALQWLYDLRHRHRVAPVKGRDKASFTDGNLAMTQATMSSYWTLPRQVGDRFKINATLIPRGPGGKRGSMGHVDMLGMYAKTKHRDEAWELHKWLTNKETSLRMALLDHGIPGARPDAWNDPQMTARPMFNVFKQAVEAGPGLLQVPWNLRMLEIGQLTEKLLDPLWTGEQSPDQVIAAAMGPYQALLDQPRPR